MTNFLDFSVSFMGFCIYSIIISLVLFVMLKAAINCIKEWQLFRDFWLMIIFLCILPLSFTFIPNQGFNYSLFDVSQLDLIGQVKDNNLKQNHFHISRNQSIELTILQGSGLLWVLIFITGFLVRVYQLCKQLVNLNHIIVSSSSLSDKKSMLDSHTFKVLSNLQSQYSVKIAITPLSTSPFVCKLRRKHLVLPELYFTNTYTNDQKMLIIEHEVIHIQRNDPGIVLLTHILGCLLWFNPFIVFFQKNMNWAIETSCDRKVLSQKPNLRRTYAQTVLKILRESAVSSSNLLTAAFSNKTIRSHTMRINNIMNPAFADVKNKPNKSTLRLSTLTLGILMFITQPQILASTHQDAIQMMSPIKKVNISANYGAKNKIHKFHKGIDFKAAINTPVVSIAKGVVRVSSNKLENKENYGKIIIIDHEDGFHSVYAHLNERSVRAGEKVSAGQVIGLVGETGRATGPHLHLELHKENQHMNPNEFIQF